MTRKSKRLATDIIEGGLQRIIEANHDASTGLSTPPEVKSKCKKQIIEAQEVATLLLKMVKEHRV